MEYELKPLAWYEVGNYLSLRIIRAAQEVFNCLGPGYPEEDYRRGVINRLELDRLDVQRRFPVDVWQSGELAELFFLDLYVEMQVVVQVLASGDPIDALSRRTALLQLEASGAPLGILLNFGRSRMEYERIFPS